MTLATRCPQCGTTFRVVSDQLKLRKGLVKCGKCLHVFNGIEFLHYFSEPTQTSVEPLAQSALAAPTPDFLGVDEPAPMSVTEVDATPSVTPRSTTPAFVSGGTQYRAGSPNEPHRAESVDAPDGPAFAGDASGAAYAAGPNGAASVQAPRRADPMTAPSALGAAPMSDAPRHDVPTPDATATGAQGPDTSATDARASAADDHAQTDRADSNQRGDAASTRDAAAGMPGDAGQTEPAPVSAPAIPAPSEAAAPARVPWYARLGGASRAASARTTASTEAPRDDEPAATTEATANPPNDAPTDLSAAHRSQAQTGTPDQAPAGASSGLSTDTRPFALRDAAPDTLNHTPTAVPSEPPGVAAEVARAVSAPATDRDLVTPAASKGSELDAILQMRERVARARLAAEVEGAPTVSPLTLIDVARQSNEPIEDRFEELPAFLRERRRTPAWVRALLGLAVLASLLGLLGQGAYVYRAELAAHVPALREPLAAACAALPDPLHCNVGLPRHITPLRVVSADLQPTTDGAFDLAVTLHNDDTIPMAYPALDVILTDVRNQVLVRRVIQADEYLRAHRDAADRQRVGLIGNAETNITVPIRIADSTVVGYTVGIFYP